jgi:hypothetical protein
MGGLGGKLIPVIILKRSRRTIFPFDLFGSLEIGLFFAAPKDKQSHTGLLGKKLRDVVIGRNVRDETVYDPARR